MLSRGLMTFFTDIPITVAGLMIFFSVFLLIVIRTFSSAMRAEYARIAEYPLRDEEGSDER